MSRKVTTALPFTELEVAGPYDGHLGNFDESRLPIDKIIIHTMDGTWEGAAERFNNPSSNVSAHYGIKYDGGLIHWLEEYWTAYHAGDYKVNQSSIGIEHEDLGNYNDPRPDALYTTSAKLVADICAFYSIPCDREHIKKHSEVSDQPTACPDALDIERIVSEASKILNPIPSPYAPTSSTGNPAIAPDVPLVLSDSTKLNFGVSLGVLEFGAVRSKLLDGIRDVTNLNSQVYNLTQTVNDLTQKLADAQKQIEALQLINKTQVQDVKDALNSAPTTVSSTVYHVMPNQPISAPNQASLLSRILNWIFRQ